MVQIGFTENTCYVHYTPFIIGTSFKLLSAARIMVQIIILCATRRWFVVDAKHDGDVLALKEQISAVVKLDVHEQVLKVMKKKILKNTCKLRDTGISGGGIVYLYDRRVIKVQKHRGNQNTAEKSIARETDRKRKEVRRSAL